MKTDYVAEVYDIFLSVPGMEEQVKVDLRTDRKTILFLCRVILRGLKNNPDNNQDIPVEILKNSTGEIEKIVDQLLAKSELSILNDKINKYLKEGKTP